MHKRQIIIIASGCVLATVAFFWTRLPAEPPGWSQVHVGMTRTQVLALTGAPQESGWPESTVETWWRENLLGTRQQRLFIGYDPYEVNHVEFVYQGIYNPGGDAWSHPRQERSP
jgi:hypothetical protein